jgi:hypothetical protein
MSRSIHESFDTAYKGGLKAARRTALRVADRATVAEALEALAGDDRTDADLLADAYPGVVWHYGEPTWVCACAGHDEWQDGEPVDGRYQCMGKGGGLKYRNALTDAWQD